MVWFQCEDCGENLKKPKLQSHFRVCSANKLSCIDCGETFSQQSVQGHTQCISEAEKYGPKGQGKASNGTPAKPNNDSKKHSDIDVNVGLSSRPPWFCSLCNTQATSKQTLLLHAEGKKHRAKARAFHAAKQQPIKTEESTPNGDSINGHPKVESVEANGAKNVDEPKASVILSSHSEEGSQVKKRRKASAYVNGEAIQAERAEAEVEPQSLPKKSKHIDSFLKNEDQRDEIGHAKEAPLKKMKWKKLITSILKSDPDRVLKVKKLQKLAVKALRESGITEDEVQLRDMLMHKINSSSRFVLENKHISLAAKTGS